MLRRLDLHGVGDDRQHGAFLARQEDVADGVLEELADVLGDAIETTGAAGIDGTVGRQLQACVGATAIVPACVFGHRGVLDSLHQCAADGAGVELVIRLRYGGFDRRNSG